MALRVYPAALIAACALGTACNTGTATSTSTPTPSATSTPTPTPTPTPTSTSTPTPTALPASTLVAREHITLVHAETPDNAAPDTLPLITVSKTHLLVNSTVIATVPPGSLGFEAAIKREGNRAALQVTPLEDALSAIHQADPSVSTARLLLDAATPYRTALEVYFTAVHAGFTTLDLVVSESARERALRISAPTRAQRKEARAGTAPPALVLVIQSDGFTLSIGSLAIGAGCTRQATGNAVTRRGAQADVDALVACTTRAARAMLPEWADLKTVQLSAAPDVDAQAVLSVVAALLPTFPEVYFGLLR